MKFSNAYMNIVWLHDESGVLHKSLSLQCEVYEFLHEVFKLLHELDAAT